MFDQHIFNFLCICVQFCLLKGLWSKSVFDTIFSGFFVGGLHVFILNADGKTVLLTIQFLSQAPFHALEWAEQRLWSPEQLFAMTALAVEIGTLSGRNFPFNYQTLLCTAYSYLLKTFFA